jgi:hypothetical protein
MNLSDFLKEIKSRISNPLISSFVIAWCVCNWKIIIGLIFYKPAQLKNDGYFSYIDLITKNTGAEKNLYLPLSIAMCYTIFYPIVNNCILAFNTWIKNWGNNWNLKISKEAKIPMSEFLSLSDVLRQKQELLENAVQEKILFQNQHDSLRSSNQEYYNRMKEVEQELQKWKDVNNTSLLNGMWEYSYFIGYDKIVTKILISGGKIQEQMEHKQFPESNKTIYSINKNPTSDQLLIFIQQYSKEINSNKETIHYIFQRLEARDVMNFLSGTEYNGSSENRVEYKKLHN